ATRCTPSDVGRPQGSRCVNENELFRLRTTAPRAGAPARHGAGLRTRRALRRGASVPAPRRGGTRLRVIARAPAAALERLADQLREFRRDARDRDAGGAERRHLLGRGAAAAGDDGTRVAHALAGRRRLARDERDHRLADVAADELRRLLLV